MTGSSLQLLTEYYPEKLPGYFRYIHDQMGWEYSFPEGEYEFGKRYGIVSLGELPIFPSFTLEAPRWRSLTSQFNWWHTELVETIAQENVAALQAQAQLYSAIASLNGLIRQSKETLSFSVLSAAPQFSVMTHEPHYCQVTITGQIGMSAHVYIDPKTYLPYVPTQKAEVEPVKPIHFY